MPRLIPLSTPISAGQKSHGAAPARSARRRGVWSAALLLAVLAGCSNPPLDRRAPVEDRMASARSGASSAGHAAGDASKLLPGAENAGKPGYYTVKQGDTLIRIGLETGQNWKDLLKWNNLENGNVIEVGQVLRVVPPGVDPNAVATRGVASSRIEMRPLEGARTSPPIAPASAPAASVSVAPLPPVASAPTVPASAPASVVAPVLPPAPASPPPVAREGDDNVNWIWPASGPVVSQFDESRSKGLTFAGKAGDPVFAAADGRVVYAGSGLRGYGNLVILKHNNTYLTAYAHNHTLLVKEDQAVKRGQKIAEMGASDAPRVQLHFEVRRQGRPVDPAKLLPAR